MATVIQPQYQNHVHVHEHDRVQVDQIRPQQHSIMEDVSDSGDEEESFEGEMDEDQDRFYHSQAQQALYYQQHQQQHAEASGQNRGLEREHDGDYEHEQQQGNERVEDEEMYSDDESSTASIPDENIDFSLTYALHTFLATVEGQASVVKGDSLLLLDDANSYWWLVRVLKTEDVGYIPAENIETPYERLARLNKHRNVDLAAATTQEKAAGAVRDREKLKGAIAGKAKEKRAATSGDGDEPAGRRVIFAPPTYVDHPGVTWSSDESDEEDEGEVEVTEVEEEVSQDDMEMEPDDGVEWADGAAQEQQNRIIEATTTTTTATATATITPKSNNPFAPRQDRKPESTIDTNPSTSPTTASTPIITVAPAVASPTTHQSAKLDPASVTETKRITATPTVAQGVLLPSAIVPQPRKVSTASTASITSTVSAGSARSSTPTSPQEEKDKKKMRKSSKDDLKDGEKKKKGGVLSGLFSRKNKKEKGISSTDARSSEESIAVDAASPSRFSDDSGRAPTPQQSASMQVSPGVSAHGLRLQQREQAAQMAYATKYLSKPDAHSPTVSEAAAAVAQSAAAMRLASMSGMSVPRPSSIIVSPNPAAPLLNVIRIFAGEHVKSEASFKTALINETTSSTDLIRQAVQRFHVAGDQADFVLTIKDVNGEEMELLPEEKPLVAFQEAVQQWSDDRELLPTVKRSSIASISSLASLSSHPAIQKLGMDFSDDSAVKIYLHRKSLAQSASIASQLSTVQESPENKSAEWSDPSQLTKSDANAAAPPGPRYNPSLTVNTTAQASPERFSSPSARFTLQLLIHPADLPDGSILDPSSDAIIPKSVLRERIAAGHPSAAQPDSRRRLYNLPRNATVVEAIEQGLERFGITEGVVDGGDDVEDRTNNRRSLARIKYTLAAVVDGQGESHTSRMVLTSERALAPSSKVIDAYTSPPALKPVERAPENRRRSRDLSTSSLADIQPSDPVFVLRRVRPRPESGGPLQRQQAQPPVIATSSEGTPLSPQEIIAAQRAATRASQRALISANSSQGVDVVVPDRGTLRSSRELHPTAGEVVRYSYIDGDGETYDISELLEEEWGRDGQRSSPSITQPPTLQRTTTDSSSYVTAPSTPAESPDILRGVLDRAAGQPEGKLEEKLERVIDKVKSRSPEDVQSGRQTPVSEHRADEEHLMDEETPRPASRTLSTVLEGRAPDGRDSRQADYHETAATVRRIISRHRQQPSIASIMSDLSGPLGHEHEHDDDGASTPLTATSSSHPTPPFSGAVYLRSVSAASPTPRAPVQYQDDFGMKALMAIVEARAKEYKKPPQSPRVAADPVQKMFWGERADEPGLHPEIKACFAPVQARLDALDSEIDELLAMLAAR
ncbi:hypothetical protein EHS25_007766 [Saitozyma podzolica]|uniref:SH3 domain-containing protein n=1 Tax=Saitozyma podzolica TaxID=1890683 RepID=A0A427YQS0_9TREE|nr:hypothetical protein EHS25_007766 [Saitozyma podzolica]